MADFQHATVMARECLEALAPSLSGENKVFVDATLGLGGHTERVVHAFPSVQVIAIDRDREALKRSKDRLAQWVEQIKFIQGDFAELATILDATSVLGIDGILFDLGVSSMQLDDQSRGFSYHHDARLDMRMNVDQKISAYDVINLYEQKELERILFEFGEEKNARRIVAAIIQKRPISTTLQLVDIIKGALPAYTLRKSGHPARKTFQAIRIEVNHELEQLRSALLLAINSLNPNGRIVVLTYHSLEDRIVKKLFKKVTTSDELVDLPMQVTPVPYVEIYPGGLTPSETEVAENPRSRSARMRVLALKGIAA